MIQSLSYTPTAAKYSTPMLIPSLHKSLPYRHRLFSKHLSLFSPPSLSSCSHPPFKPLSSSSSSATMSTAPTTTVEHIVLFKVKPSATQSQISSMISNLQSLSSLSLTSFLTAVPILRRCSAAADELGFTHLLHSRYPSKSNLSTYAAHEDHVSVVKNFVLPNVDDIMAVDWVSDKESLVMPEAGKAIRVTIVKANEGVTATDVVKVIGEMEVAGKAQQVSFGENFSPGRGKGYDVAMVSMFKSVEEIDSLMEDKEFVEQQKEKVRPLLEKVIVLDYVVPSTTGAASL